jgi:hypothetical protein
MMNRNENRKGSYLRTLIGMVIGPMATSERVTTITSKISEIHKRQRNKKAG